MRSNKEAIEIILEAVEKAKYKPGSEVMISIDAASTEIFKKGKYYLSSENKTFDSDQMIQYFVEICKNYPIFSIEDAMSENDWIGWKNITTELGNKILLVGDDLFVTNISRLKKGINKSSANAILIKPNQVGTLSETLETIHYAKKK